MTNFPFPVLDLRDLDSTPASAAAFRAQLLAATHDVGFFYLTGTGVTRDLETRLLTAARAFFALPEEEKLKIENLKRCAHHLPFPLTSLSPHFRGYTRLGGERTQGAPDHREQLDIWPEDTALSPADLENAPPYMRLVGPNLWPAALPDLRAVVHEWESVVIPAAHRLLRAWALALGAEEDFFDRHFRTPSTRLKIVRYPPADPRDGMVGVGAHKDGGCVTLLWVQPGSGGLQIQPDAGGAWVDAPPVAGEQAGVFVCNIGEMIELATGGYLKATVHRVLSQGEERLSVPMFVNPSLDAAFPVLELPAHLVQGGPRGKGRKGSSADDDGDDRIHAVYGDNLLKSRLRAHPDVAAIHHPDLVQSGRY